MTSFESIVQRVLPRSTLRYLLPAASLLGTVIVFFVAGAYVAEFKSPVYRTMLEPSFQGLRALEQRWQWEYSDLRFGWYPAKDGRTGVVTYKPDLAYEGATVYATCGEPTTARLISMQGEVLHQWYLPFREAWPDPQHIEEPVEEGRIHWHTIHLFPNGDLLANYVAIAARPYGYGLVRMNKDSQVIWKYSGTAHHSFDVGPDGKIYALQHDFENRRIDGASHLRRPMLEDSVVVLSPDGDELQRVSVFDAFVNSPFQGYLQSMQSDVQGDHTHGNAIDVISPAFARQHPFCSAGYVMLSFRNPSLLAILNLENKQIVWAAHGAWRHQHDSDPLENGNIMVFDNLGNRGSGGRSRILEWNPQTGAIPWCYRGNRKHPFESDVRGGQQLLPNQNVLITESNTGRIFEVTRQGKIAWEYRTTDRPGKNHEMVGVICGAVRHAPDELTFLAEKKTAQTEPELKGQRQ